MFLIIANKSNISNFEGKSIFQKQISTNYIDIRLLSNIEYVHHLDRHFEIYCISSEYSKIFCNKKQFVYSSVENALDHLQKNISKGVFILITEEGLFIGGPLFDVSLSWMDLNDELIISDSATNIALFLDLPISKSALALNLIYNLPYYPFQNIPLWEKVNKIQPFHILKCTTNGILETIKTWTPPNLENKVETIYPKIRERLLELLSQNIANYSEISADLSGGVDSATIIYILKALKATTKLYHAKADSEWNSDSKWAKLISNDINTLFTSLPSLGNSGKNFKIDMDYSNSVLPDSPLLWADTEGYVESIENSALTPANATHFTGLGGDELFTSMPANAWSLVRQNKLRSIDLGLRYCLLNRIPISVGMVNLTNNNSFKEAVKHEIDKGFGYAKSAHQNSALNWCGPVTVPNWLTKPYRELSYKTLIDKLDNTCDCLDPDRSRHQMIESLLFQRHLVTQINNIYGVNGMTWQAPFLDVDIINYSLAIPARYRQDHNVTKSILYHSTKGLVSKNIFTRGFKGDYSTGLYKSYKDAVNNYSHQIHHFKLVELGIIDADILISELSMPSALHTRVEAFERLAAVERWLRVALK
ncbi:asparagine synthase-related protein [Enterococcus gilvus]|uniref:asparagine synthase-related protein n=1 Tax=Enterococcus gilvus TaxID=160453 RepID=UPI003D6C2490